MSYEERTYHDVWAYRPKRTEKRTSHTTYRGPSLIHGSLARDRGQCCQVSPSALACGVRSSAPPNSRAATRPTVCCPGWGFPDRRHRGPTDVEALTVPVPAKGALGLWTPSDDTLQAVRDQPCPIYGGHDDVGTAQRGLPPQRAGRRPAARPRHPAPAARGRRARTAGER
jgi:hypothetical protein